jgi:hypothetical protein
MQGWNPSVVVRERTPIMRVKGMNVRRCLGVAAVALVTACGGGEDGAAGADTGAQAVALSVQNEPTLSAAAVREFAGAQRMADLSAGAGPGQLSIASLPVRRAMAAMRQPGRVNAQAEVTTADCSGGGTVTIETGDDLLSSKSTFNACIEADATLNGAISLAPVSTSNDELLRTFDATLTALSATVGGITAKVSGSLRLTLDNGTAGQTKASFSGTTLSFEQSASGQVQVSSTLRDLQFTDIRTDAGQLTDSFSFTNEGTLAALGTLAYKAETLTALVTPTAAAEPTSGQVKVTVNGKGIILLTVEATRVHVQADLEGNGSFEVDRFDTWSNLSGGL